MAHLGKFDARQHEPRPKFEPLPEGTYEAIIISSDWVYNRTGTGRHLAIRFEVISGPFKGRTLFSRLNLDNPNSKVVQCAQAELSSICRAVGCLQIEDSEQLHDLPLLIRVRTKKVSNPERLLNEIVEYSPIENCSKSASFSSWSKP